MNPLVVVMVSAVAVSAVPYVGLRLRRGQPWGAIAADARAMVRTLTVEHIPLMTGFLVVMWAWNINRW